MSNKNRNCTTVHHTFFISYSRNYSTGRKVSHVWKLTKSLRTTEKGATNYGSKFYVQLSFVVLFGIRKMPPQIGIYYPYLQKTNIVRTSRCL